MYENEDYFFTKKKKNHDSVEDHMCYLRAKYTASELYVVRNIIVYH